MANNPVASRSATDIIADSNPSPPPPAAHPQTSIPERNNELHCSTTSPSLCSNWRQGIVDTKRHTDGVSIAGPWERVCPSQWAWQCQSCLRCLGFCFTLTRILSHIFHESHSEGASAGVFELAVAIRYDDADIYGTIGLEIYLRLDTHRTLGCPMSTLTLPPWTKQVGYEENKLIQAYLTLSCLTFVISEVGGCHAILAEKDGRYAMQCTKFFNVEIDRAGTRFLPTSHIAL